MIPSHCRRDWKGRRLLSQAPVRHNRVEYIARVRRPRSGLLACPFALNQSRTAGVVKRPGSRDVLGTMASLECRRGCSVCRSIGRPRGRAGCRERPGLPLRHRGRFPFASEALRSMTLTSAVAFGRSLAGGFSLRTNTRCPARIDTASRRQQLQGGRAHPARRCFLEPPGNRLDRHAD